ncbi:hypothetical protein MWU75_02975 [Ornithinimicrobium sp. F0845]|uniref:hypothetical protein n=1 Tax=Ornithinimicrobium sp. F0845 TaxID=2926412 RepID=UPI001FF42AC2|nr:hypothetical protein [Ornithinimicrobium sp. F0845]MCK0111104.1 hypothetical protein [Ornithinimicrobium sp. F0845]
MSPMVRLRPSARPVRRAPGEVQFGLSPAHGIVLAGLTEPETELLLSLAGSGGTSRDTVLAQRFGVPVERVTDLVDTLGGHGLLVDPGAAPRRADDCYLAVPGRGEVIDRIRGELTGLGAGRLVAGEGDPANGDVSLVVLCAADAIAPDQGRPWQVARVPQLPVVLRDGEVVIGPLVHPGRSACLRCLDLHRRDRDRAWPTILTQITSPAVELTRRVDAPPAHANAVAALVAMITLECLVSVESVLGVSWHLSLPLPDVRTRRWERHPACDCATHT